MFGLNEPPGTGVKVLAWSGFALFVIASWAIAILFFLTGGWAPCSETGSCTSDRIGAIIILLLLPMQAGLAVFLKRYLKGR